MSDSNTRAVPETRQRLLSAAVDIIIENGIAGVTHRSLEDRAHVSRGSTRYHFGTRKQLLEAIATYVAESDSAVLSRAAEASGGSLEPGVMDKQNQDAALASMTQLFLGDTDRAIVRFELYLYAARHPELSHIMTTWRQAFIKFGASHLRAIGAPQPEVGSTMMNAAMDGMILHALSAPHARYLKWGPTWIAEIAHVAARLGTQTQEADELE